MTDNLKRDPTDLAAIDLNERLYDVGGLIGATRIVFKHGLEDLPAPAYVVAAKPFWRPEAFTEWFAAFLPAYRKAVDGDTERNLACDRALKKRHEWLRPAMDADTEAERRARWAGMTQEEQQREVQQVDANLKAYFDRKAKGKTP